MYLLLHSFLYVVNLSVVNSHKIFSYISQGIIQKKMGALVFGKAKNDCNWGVQADALHVLV